MNVQRSDIVLLDFPFPSGLASKVRPALVIQNNRDNDRLPNTVVAQITSSTHRAFEATQVLIQTNLAEGKQSGLLFDSVVNCVNVVTVEKSRVLRKIGNLPAVHMQQVNDALKVTFELS